MKKINLLLVLFGLLILTSGLASAISGASYVTQQYEPNFQTYYSSSAGDGLGSRYDTYWPILGNRETCDARQDVLLQVSPGGCQPAVVRSDLLAEQNVPVFCQVDALQINPLIKISQINNIRFTGKYPKDVVGAGFHPARAAISTRDTLLGSPLINNIGYVVVVLKKNEIEKNLPDSVSVNLSARIEYDSGNAIGIGRSEFILKPQTDNEWSVDRNKQSFFQGRYYIRLDDANDQYATISIYEGDRRISTTRINRGQSSANLYLPGFYCRAALQVSYDGFIGAEDKATIEIGDGNTLDKIDVYRGSRFLNDRCSVQDLQVDPTSKTGNVTISCPGQTFIIGTSLGTQELKEKDRIIYFGQDKVNGEKGYYVGLVNGKYRIHLDKGLDLDANIKDVKRDVSTENNQLALTEKMYDKDSNGNSVNGSLTEESFKQAIAAYEKVADDYPNEKGIAVDAQPAFGEWALEDAIKLAESMNKLQTQARLMQKYINLYPQGEMSRYYTTRLNELYTFDQTYSSDVVQVNGQFKTIRLVSLDTPAQGKTSADFSLDGRSLNLQLSDNRYNYRNTNADVDINKKLIDGVSRDIVTKEAPYLRMVYASDRYVILDTNCPADNSGNKGSPIYLSLDNYNQNTNNFFNSNYGSSVKVCGKVLHLDRINLEQIAKIRITPTAQGTQTETNLTVNIGIEKRAIKLSTEKTEDMIKTLNDSIKKWDKISNNLGKLVTGMKGACFATSAVLTAKNFLTGLNGESIARQKVMRGPNGWTTKCGDLVAAHKYETIGQCYNEEAANIDKDVDAMTKVINDVNDPIKNVIEKDCVTTTNSLFGENFVNAECAGPKYEDYILTHFPTCKVNDGKGNEVAVSQLISKDGYKNGLYSYDHLREIHTSCLMQQQDSSGGTLSNISKNSLTDVIKDINDRKVINQQAQELIKNRGEGYANPIFASTGPQSEDRIADVVPVNNLKNTYNFNTTDGVTYSSTVIVPPSAGNANTGTTDVYKAGVYILGLKQTPDGQKYTVSQVFNKDTKEELNAPAFVTRYGIGNIVAQDSVSYHNKILNPEVRYYETEPYKGLPAQVPFDLQNGWYVGTKQTLPAFGGQGAFDASGKVSSFWLCNVGSNMRIQFLEGMGDDSCQLVNLNTGQPLGVFPGLSSDQAQSLVSRGIKALNEAAGQYASGRKSIQISGAGALPVGRPSANLPATQCQDFMSPEDCNLMFNVCDPVICPPSRCDLGGAYPVSDVVQTGIVGSLLLCLPNAKEGIAVPICITGVKAGIDGYLSILKAHRDCLQENLATGKTVGICDEIYSIYLCEFFWRQLSPVANILIPKLIENVYGQGHARGGGEYLTVDAAWQNMRSSIDYFTQTYAVNSLKAFNARSVEEAGGEFCKSFIGAKGPKSFESLLEADSPPQFHATFSQTKFSDVTVPATSQYKVFYHIFAGNDQGIYYNVYLKSPPASSYYYSTPTIQVASGFIARGEYKDETKDFTAPEGYKELCVNVNGQEKCGFGELSTSFAVNYLRDQYTAGQINQTGITSQTECISGSPSAASILANANPQSAGEEAILPQDYNRGIVRICATSNPGSATDPARFVNVGYCGDQKVVCWLDKNSVENAITDNNIGQKNESLAELAKTQNARLQASGDIFRDGDAAAEIKTLTNAQSSLSGNGASVSTAAKPILDRIDFVFGRVVLNHQKANLLYVKGLVLDKVSRAYFGDYRTAHPAAQVKPVNNAPTTTNNVPSNTQTSTAGLSLDKSYDSSKPTGRYNVLSDGKPTNVYIDGTKVMKENTFLSFDPLAKDTQIGVVKDGTIQLTDSAKSSISNLYPQLNNAKISGTRIGTINEQTSTVNGGTTNTLEPVVVSLDKTYNSLDNTKNYIYFNGKASEMYVYGDTVYLNLGAAGSKFLGHVEIDGYINIKDDVLHDAGIQGYYDFVSVVSINRRTIKGSALLPLDESRFASYDKVYLGPGNYIYFVKDGQTLKSDLYFQNAYLYLDESGSDEEIGKVTSDILKITATKIRLNEIANSGEARMIGKPNIFDVIDGATVTSQNDALVILVK